MSYRYTTQAKHCLPLVSLLFTVTPSIVYLDLPIKSLVTAAYLSSFQVPPPPQQHLSIHTSPCTTSYHLTSLCSTSTASSAIPQAHGTSPLVLSQACKLSLSILS